MSEEIKKTESLSPEENQETENVSVEEQKTEFKAEKKSDEIKRVEVALHRALNRLNVSSHN